MSDDYVHEVVPGLAQSVGERIAVQLATAVRRYQIAEALVDALWAKYYAMKDRAHAAEARVRELEAALETAHDADRWI